MIKKLKIKFILWKNGKDLIDKFYNSKNFIKNDKFIILLSSNIRKHFYNNNTIFIVLNLLFFFFGFFKFQLIFYTIFILQKNLFKSNF